MVHIYNEPAHTSVVLLQNYSHLVLQSLPALARWLKVSLVSGWFHAPATMIQSAKLSVVITTWSILHLATCQNNEILEQWLASVHMVNKKQCSTSAAAVNWLNWTAVCSGFTQMPLFLFKWQLVRECIQQHYSHLYVSKLHTSSNVIKKATASTLTRLHWDQQQAWHHRLLDPLVEYTTDCCRIHAPTNINSKCHIYTHGSHVKNVRFLPTYILVVVSRWSWVSHWFSFFHHFRKKSWWINTQPV